MHKVLATELWKSCSKVLRSLKEDEENLYCYQAIVKKVSIIIVYESEPDMNTSNSTKQMIGKSVSTKADLSQERKLETSIC